MNDEFEQAEKNFRISESIIVKGRKEESAKNYHAAELRYREAIEYGNLDGYFYLARLYYSGKGVEKNLEIAISYFKIAGESNNVKAQVNLGIIYGDLKDYNNSRLWHEKAMRNGDINAMYNLGLLYRNIEAPFFNQTTSFEYMYEASKLNHLPAMIETAIGYYFGIGVEENKEKAEEMRERVAESGTPMAVSYLDKMLLSWLNKS